MHIKDNKTHGIALFSRSLLMCIIALLSWSFFLGLESLLGNSSMGYVLVRSFRHPQGSVFRYQHHFHPQGPNPELDRTLVCGAFAIEFRYRSVWYRKGYLRSAVRTGIRREPNRGGINGGWQIYEISRCSYKLMRCAGAALTHALKAFDALTHLFI